jgi:glycosyltransferase involved in cell wall biosynthesis
MAKIAFVSQPRDAVAAADAQTGSVTIVMWELAKRVARQHDVVVFAPQASGQAPEEVSGAGPRIKRIPLAMRLLHKAMDLGTGALRLTTPYFASTLFFREYALSVAHGLRHERPEIIHVQNCTQFLPVFHQAAPQARLFLHVHDEFLSLLPEKVIRPRLEHVTAIVTCSNFVTQRLQARLPYLAGRIHTVGNGVDTAYFESSERSVEPGKFRILYVGRVSPEKGVHILARAFSRLAAEDEGVELDVVGPAGLLPFNQIRLLSGDPQVAALSAFYGTGFWGQLDKQLIHAHSSYWRTIEAGVPEPLRDRIHCRGLLSRGTLKSVYQRAHVLAMPSVCMEPFGLPLAEAMASSLPCVASRTGGIPDILLDNATGLLVERGSVGALTDALRRLSQDSGLREQMGRTARQRAEEVFDWSMPAARLESLYRQQLAAGPFTLEESRAAARPVT